MARGETEAGVPEDEALARAVEEVREHLVAVRGGAPFLSAQDARRLLAWLEAGVPVAAILAAVDRVAERRRQRRVRGRLTLAACRREVERLRRRGLSGAAPAPAPGAREPAKGLARLAGEIAEMPVPDGLLEERQALSDALADLAAAPLSQEERARRAAAACRRFQRAAWERADREAARAAAAEELAGMREVVSERVFADLVEEAARHRVQRAWPLVNASVVWDRLEPSSSGKADA